MDILSINYSQIDLDVCKKYLNFEEGYTEEDVQILMCLEGAKSLIEKLTGKDSEFLDTEKMSTILLLKAMSDFYINKLSSSAKETMLDPMFRLLINQITDLKAGGLV